jgi:hypothetical protein
MSRLMISRMLRSLVGLVFLVAIFQSHVLACSCSHVVAGKPCELLKPRAEVVFVGTVYAAENPPDPSSHDDSGRARYSFHVDEAISAITAKEIDVYSGRGCCDCSISFRVGGKSLVDAWRGEDAQVSASICSKTRQFRESDAPLPELRLSAMERRPTLCSGFCEG